MDFLQGQAAVYQRRGPNEDPIEVSKLAASDYFGKIFSFYDFTIAIIQSNIASCNNLLIVTLLNLNVKTGIITADSFAIFNGV